MARNIVEILRDQIAQLVVANAGLAARVEELTEMLQPQAEPVQELEPVAGE